MKILLVRLSSMGDLVHTLPALTDLSRHRPDVSLDWLCESAFADIARLHPFTASVVPMAWRRWRKQLWRQETLGQMSRLRQTLRARRYDWVLDSQGLLKSAVFARWAGAPVCGLDGHSAREPAAACFYTRRMAVAWGRDAVWRNRCLFAQAFGYWFEGRADFGLPPQAAPTLAEPPYLVLLHAASRADKLWLPAYWQDLARRWHERCGGTVLLPWGSESERQCAQALAGDWDFVRVCPQMDLAQAAAVLGGAAAVVGVDTGLLHLADAVGVPVVGIYTASNPLATGVQVSPRARTVGGIGRLPDTEAVWAALSAVCRQAA